MLKNQTSGMPYALCAVCQGRLLAGLLNSGQLSQQYTLLYLLAPLVLYLGKLAVKGDSYDELEKLHTYGLMHVVLFLVITLLITSPTVMAGVFIVATLASQAFILKNKIDSR